MAIQVSGTQVIGNSRELTNIASVDATTAASITAAGVGGSAVPISDWDPTTTPDVTFSSSGTWTNPNTSDDTLVVFFAVGGGASGNNGFYSYGGGGGAAAVITGTMGQLPSSLSLVVGAGPVAPANNGTAGGNTTIAGNGITYTAEGGRASSGAASGKLRLPPITDYFAPVPQPSEVNGTIPQYREDDGMDNVYGGAGGGGGSNTSTGMGSGANGSIRIWYLTA